MKPGEFVAGDFEALAAYEHYKRVKSVYEALLDVFEPLKDAIKYVTPYVLAREHYADTGIERTLPR